MGWSQTDLGREVGRKWKAVSEWERGKRPPDQELLQTMAERHGWPIEVFEEGGRMPRELIHDPLTASEKKGPSEAARGVTDFVRELGQSDDAGLRSSGDSSAVSLERSVVKWAAGRWENPEDENEAPGAILRGLLQELRERLGPFVQADDMRKLHIEVCETVIAYYKRKHRAIPQDVQSIYNLVIEGRFE